MTLADIPEAEWVEDIGYHSDGTKFNRVVKVKFSKEFRNALK
jgi:hypothetical protein